MFWKTYFPSRYTDHGFTVCYSIFIYQNTWCVEIDIAITFYSDRQTLTFVNGFTNRFQQTELYQKLNSGLFIHFYNNNLIRKYFKSMSDSKSK